MSSWLPSTVTLIDGREVLSDSAEWMQECEARHVLAKTIGERAELLLTIAKRRGPDAATALKERCYLIEPHHVLSLPSKAQRNAYCAQVEARFGPPARHALEAKVRELWNNRKAVANNNSHKA